MPIDIVLPRLNSYETSKSQLKGKSKKENSGKMRKKRFKISFISLLSFFQSHIDSGAAIPRVSREFASTILAHSTRASLAALTSSSSEAITGTKR